ncbi:response regulator [Paenibacillus sp. SI8]|uniref:response regulator n=1 Tax=unclassified Paenibacillus TaxID=185978 RepID=UPI003467BDD3
MIRALLVDDERLALLQLEKMLKELTSIDIVAAYIDPAEAVQTALQSQPDVIFLDIDMPEMNGMEAAEILREACPTADIVFVTAYDRYAVEAFELNVLDYVLKPVQRNRLMKTISRLEERLALNAAKLPHDQRVIIRCCPSLSIEREGQPQQILRWRTTKAQELFAYLLQVRNRFVSNDTLIDMLWPNFEPKKASTHLYTTIYQVRQCLKQADVDVQISNVSGGAGYILNTQNVLIDTDQWENTFRELSPIDTHNCEEHHRLVERYSGDYYGDYDYLWAESERQRLRRIWLHLAMQVAAFYTENNGAAQAVTIYQRIVHIQPYYEDAHLGLMKMFNRMGERAAVEEQFRLLSALLHRDLGIGLSASVEKWYGQWREQNARSL